MAMQVREGSPGQTGSSSTAVRSSSSKRVFDISTDTDHAATSIQKTWRRRLAERHVDLVRIIYQDAKGKIAAEGVQPNGSRRGSAVIIKDIQESTKSCLQVYRTIHWMRADAARAARIRKLKVHLSMMYKIKKAAEESSQERDRLWLDLYGTVAEIDDDENIEQVLDDAKVATCDLAARKIQQAWLGKKLAHSIDQNEGADEKRIKHRVDNLKRRRRRERKDDEFLERAAAAAAAHVSRLKSVPSEEAKPPAPEAPPSANPMPPPPMAEGYKKGSGGKHADRGETGGSVKEEPGRDEASNSILRPFSFAPPDPPANCSAAATPRTKSSLPPLSVPHKRGRSGSRSARGETPSSGSLPAQSVRTSHGSLSLGPASSVPRKQAGPSLAPLQVPNAKLSSPAVPTSNISAPFQTFGYSQEGPRAPPAIGHGGITPPQPMPIRGPMRAPPAHPSISTAATVSGAASARQPAVAPLVVSMRAAQHAPPPRF